ncbi:MAG: RnfH family protein [Gammaproteobacteria bacterium]|nr:RnfH family protein [Gammaproteobacteria bacterium]MBT4492887.1 RnfH family protein [Gammaproteobacteria bacterium]MBT7371386.1 RnfH family protein [Gammaproteobacteria bacterium]
MNTVEVVFATPKIQRFLEVDVEPGATLIEAVVMSNIMSDFPEYDIGELKKGVWGEVKADDYVVVDGDRIEIYRPLVADPRETRKRRAGRRS